MSDISQWFQNLPTFTRHWLGLTVGISLIGRFGLLKPQYLILLHEPLINGFEVCIHLFCTYIFIRSDWQGSRYSSELVCCRQLLTVALRWMLWVWIRFVRTQVLETHFRGTNQLYKFKQENLIHVSKFNVKIVWAVYHFKQGSGNNLWSWQSSLSRTNETKLFCLCLNIFSWKVLPLLQLMVFSIL